MKDCKGNELSIGDNVVYVKGKNLQLNWKQVQ